MARHGVACGGGRPEDPIHFMRPSSIKYFVPALLYAIDNNLIQFILTHVDFPTFALLGNMKIVFTTVLMRCSGLKVRPDGAEPLRIRRAPTAEGRSATAERGLRALPSPPSVPAFDSLSLRSLCL